MGNDVRITVKSTNDTKATRDQVRRDFASMGIQAGNDFSKNLENALKDKAIQVGDKAGQDFNKGLTRSSKGGAKDVGKDFSDSLKSGIKGDVTIAGKELGDEFAQAFNSGAKNAGKGFAERVYLNARAGLRPAGEELGREFSDSFDGKTTNAGKKTGQQVGKNITDEASKQTSAKGALIALGIEAALGPAGGVAGAAVAGGFALGLAGLGIAVAAQTDKVKTEFGDLTNSVKTSFLQWGTDIQAPVAASIGYIQNQFQHLAPIIDDDLKATAPGIKVLAVGLGELAANAIPGVNSAAHSMGPVWEGIRTLMASVGTDIGGLAQTAGDHSAAIGTDFTHVGNVVTSVVSLADHLIGQLSEDFAVHGGQLTGALHSIDGAVTSLGSGAFPALGAAVGGDLEIIKGFFDLIGAGGAPLGMLAGGIASAATNAKLLGLAKEPLDGLAKKLNEAGDEGTTFGNATSKAGTIVGKFAQSLPLVGVALTGLSLLLDQSAQHASELAQAGAEVAKGLEQGGTSAVLARQQLNQWHQDVTDGQKALEDAKHAQGDYNDVLEAGATGLSASGLAQQTNNSAIDDANTKIQTAMDAYNKYAIAAGLAGLSTDQFTGKVKTYDSSATNATSNTAQLAADMLVLKDNTAGADQKIKALQDTLALMADQGLQKADDAMDSFGKTIDAFVQGAPQMSGAVFDATGQLNSMSDAGRTVRQVIEDGRDSMVAYAQAAADAGVPQDQINAKLGTMAQQLANTIAPAVGSQGAAQNLLDTYHAMPADITTNLHADTSQAQGAINSFIAMNNGRQIGIMVYANGAVGGLASAGRGESGKVVGSAANGRMSGGEPTWMGERGPELASYMGHTSVIAAPSLTQPPVGTRVSSAADSARQLAQSLHGGAGGGGTVHFYIDAADDPASQAILYILRKSIRTQGGNVQVVLGKG